MPEPRVENDATRSAEQLDLIRRRVIAVIGHELRTPVTTLRGLAGQLASADEEQIRTVLAPGLERNAARLEALLDDLLIASEITTALPVSEPAPVKVGAAARAAIAAVGGEDGTLAVEGEVDLQVAARAGVVDRILRHLFDNALKYGRPPITVDVHAAGEGMAAIDVHSPGEAAAEADLALAFELFYRGERAVTSAAGLGIGLPAARALARQDGGDLRLAPREGGGVVMHLTLPAA